MHLARLVGANHATIGGGVDKLEVLQEDGRIGRRGIGRRGDGQVDDMQTVGGGDAHGLLLIVDHDAKR